MHGVAGDLPGSVPAVGESPLHPVARAARQTAAQLHTEHRHTRAGGWHREGGAVSR